MPPGFSGSAAGLRVWRRARPARPAGRLVAGGGLLAFALLVTGCAASSSTAPGHRTAAGQVGIQDGVAKAAQRNPWPGVSLVATAKVAQIVVHTTPGGAVSSRMANPTSIGAPLTFLVLDTQAGWLQVSLPVRPNGSTGWIQQSDVTITNTPYRLVVSETRHQLQVIYRGKLIATHPVGVGKSVTPTPPGTYYLTELIKPPDPHGAYGPYAFGLSAFSNTLQTFAGGPGQLGLHGTDDPQGVGHDVSHGCLRVANTVITQLARQLPLGTPVEIRQ